MPFAVQSAVSEGRRHATALTNAVLTEAHLPALPLGLLAGVPNLRQAAAAKLVQQQTTALQELAACLQQLQAAVAGLAEASASLLQLLDAEADRPVLADGAVFATLSMQLVSGMVQDVHSMHQEELAVKSAVCQGFEQILGELGSWAATASAREPHSPVG
jgi:uroporphyrinogen-III decarboxylase